MRPGRTNRGEYIAIDIGTKFGRVGIWQNGHFNLIPNEYGERKTPCLIAFTDAGRLFGTAAKLSLGSLDPANVVYDIRRLIGRRFNEKEVQDDMKHWPFKIICGERGNILIEVISRREKKTFCPEELFAMLLLHLKKQAEAYLGTSVTNACVTIPAFFHEGQRQATMDACHIAGLEVKLLSDPMASCILYSLERQVFHNKVIIFDLGGGSLDVTLALIEDGILEVRATSGDCHLGGEDFDRRLAIHFALQFNDSVGIDITGNLRAMERLCASCERAKCLLSSGEYAIRETMNRNELDERNGVRIEIDNLVDGHNFSALCTREIFESLCGDLFAKCLDHVRRVIADAKSTVNEIATVVVVGGSSRIPCLQYQLRELFEGRPVDTTLNPDESVIYGAAVEAGMLSQYFERDDSTEIERFFRDRLLGVDVTSHSIGLETAGGVMTVLLPRNTPLPERKRQIFSTYYDNQESVTFTMYEGEKSMTRDNRKLGLFEIYDIPKMPRGKPQIEVEFDLDVQGVLRVSGQDKNTGTLYHIRSRADKDLLTRAEIDERNMKVAKMDLSDGRLLERVFALQRLEQCVFAMQQLAVDLEGSNLIENDVIAKRSILEKFSCEIMEGLGASILGRNSDPSIQHLNEMSESLLLEEFQLNNFQQLVEDIMRDCDLELALSID